MPKDRGAEQGDVDGPLECSLALGMVAAEARGRIAAQQAAATLPWIGVNDSTEEQRLQADHAARLQESANFQLGGPENFTGAHDLRNVLQKSGGLADQWYITLSASQSGIGFKRARVIAAPAHLEALIAATRASCKQYTSHVTFSPYQCAC